MHTGNDQEQEASDLTFFGKEVIEMWMRGINMMMNN